MGRMVDGKPVLGVEDMPFILVLRSVIAANAARKAQQNKSAQPAISADYARVSA